MSKLEQYALAKYPGGRIDGQTYEDIYGEIVWITTGDKSTHAVSQLMMLMDIEGIRHSDEMQKIRQQIAEISV